MESRRWLYFSTFLLGGWRGILLRPGRTRPGMGRPEGQGGWRRWRWFTGCVWLKEILDILDKGSWRRSCQATRNEEDPTEHLWMPWKWLKNKESIRSKFWEINNFKVLQSSNAVYNKSMNSIEQLFPKCGSHHYWRSFITVRLSSVATGL